MDKGVGWTGFQANEITGAKVMVRMGPQKVCQRNWGRVQEQKSGQREGVDWIWGRPARELCGCQFLRGTKIKIYNAN